MVSTKTMVDAMDGAVIGRRSRRFHSAQLKAQVVEACTQPDVSVSAVALSHGLNANLVRRWMKAAAAKGRILELSVLKPSVTPTAAFLPVQLQAAKPAADIRIELRRGGATVVVSWPVHEAAACGRWLHDWLR